MQTEINLRNKYFWEECARQMLLEFGDSTFADLRNADKPDLQGAHWGIEVTQALTRQDGEINALSNRVMNKSIAEIAPKDKKKIEEHEILCREYNGKIVTFTPPAQLLDDTRILDSFEQKLRKLNSDNYADFLYYGLFQFAEEYFDEKEIIEITDKMNLLQERFARRFSRLFVSCLSNRLWLCDLTTNSISSINLRDHWQSKFDTTIIPNAEQYCLAKALGGDTL